MKLEKYDLIWAVRRLPSNLKKIMQDKKWINSIFVGGGFIRSCIANEKINDIDVFVKSEKKAELLANKLAFSKKDIYKTENAYTIKGKLTIQIIHRWVFEKPEDVSNSFDFTICCAVIFFDGNRYDSYCDDKFYIDLAAKRLRYRIPERNEDAGGSMLRVLKYYQRGYRIPLDSLGAVIARLVRDIDTDKASLKEEEYIGSIITGLLREVDPSIDPTHQAHMNSLGTDKDKNIEV